MKPSHDNLVRVFGYIQARIDESDMKRLNDLRALQICVDKAVNVLSYDFKHQDLLVAQHLVPGVIRAWIGPSPDPSSGLYTTRYQLRFPQLLDSAHGHQNTFILRGLKEILLVEWEGRGSAVFLDKNRNGIELTDQGLWKIENPFKELPDVKYIK